MVLRAMIRALMALLLSRALHVEGRSNLPRRGPLLLVGNHTGTVDPPLTGALVPRRDLHYMAKSESFANPWNAWLLRAFNAFPVVRHSADRSSLRQALDVLQGGHALMVYPEGSRSPDGRLRRPLPGVGFLARRSGAVIVPVAVWGSENVLPRGSLRLRRAPVEVRFGEAFTVPDHDETGSAHDNQAIADLLMWRVAELMPEGRRGPFGLSTVPATSRP